MSGGDALYLDEGQLCWTLTAKREDLLGSMDAVLMKLVQGMGEGLKKIFVGANFSKPNSLEVNGKTLGMVYLGEKDDIWIAHGVLLECLDIETQLKVLRAPKEKLNPDGILLAAARFITLHELIGPDSGDYAGALFASLAQSTGLAIRIAPTLDACADVIPEHPPMSYANAVSAFLVTPGGNTLRATLNLSFDGLRVMGCSLHGDVLVRPSGLYESLCNDLVGHLVVELDAYIRRFFACFDWEMLGCATDDVVRLFNMVVLRKSQQEKLEITADQANSLMIHDPQGDGDVSVLLNVVDAVLVPYCAKPVWCKWRHRDGCPECGMCAVGVAYHLARQRHIPVITIRNFEHLESVLSDFKASDSRAYVGMCCSHFYRKRYRAFEHAMMPALLMDISGSNCYELGQENLAYEGRFEAQSEINRSLLEKVMVQVPPARDQS
ncbi:hypothetical protein BI364_05090 [Acidihalobacter yilgarnensis]|uniref:BPL/LPL catalytic domain-containing protein n=1 Tax=Acidihalobacter yilgarnensis TaxID=2819280 RepID=A0A1D8ILV0_9GAMM|nr:hypothetical protein BI364_05090 [Acidihalobacter yilgarnensis]